MTSPVLKKETTSTYGLHPDRAHELSLEVTGIYHEQMAMALQTGYLPKFGIDPTIAAKAMKIAAKRFPEKSALISIAMTEFSFNRRRYGDGQFYCWARHTKVSIADPWPAVHYPKAVLYFETARAFSL